MMQPGVEPESRRRQVEMDKRTKLVAGTFAAVAVVAVGAGVGVASGGDDDKPLRGGAYSQATAAALEHVGGGTVVETEAGDSGAAYEVEVRRDDGSVVEVELDEHFEVIGSAGDDDGSGEESESGDDD
jgi:uncharacterized membrane protein YkoI